MKTIKYIILVLSMLIIMATFIFLFVNSKIVNHWLIYLLIACLAVQAYFLFAFTMIASSDWLNTLKELHTQRRKYIGLNCELKGWIMKIGEHEAIKLIKK